MSATYIIEIKTEREKLVLDPMPFEKAKAWMAKNPKRKVLVVSQWQEGRWVQNITEPRDYFFFGSDPLSTSGGAA